MSPFPQLKKAEFASFSARLLARDSLFIFFYFLFVGCLFLKQNLFIFTLSVTQEKKMLRKFVTIPVKGKR